MNIPRLENNAFCLIRAEKKTGIILNNDNSRYLNTGNNYYMIFDDLQQIELYIENEITKSQDIEYLIYDANGAFVKMIR